MNWDGSTNGTNGEVPISFGGSPGYDLWLQNGFFGFNVGASDIYGISSAGLANQWHFVTAVFKNALETNDLLYIDGVQQGLSMKQGAATTGKVSTTAYLGDYQTTAFPFSGGLSQVAFFNAKLTAAQITTEYNGGAQKLPRTPTPFSTRERWPITRSPRAAAASPAMPR